MIRYRIAILVVVVGVCTGVARVASAQEAPAAADVPAVAPPALRPAAAQPSESLRPPSLRVAPRAESPRSPVLTFLYGFTAGTQAMDVHSTRRALEAGAFETNPFMRAISSHTSGLIATKAGMTVGTIMVTEAIARHHKTTAILTLIAINAAYVYVVERNYDVSRRVR